MLPDLLSPFTFGRWSGTAEDIIRTEGSFLCPLSSSPLQGEGSSSMYRGGIIRFLICSCLHTVTVLMEIARLFFHSYIIWLWAWFSELKTADRANSEQTFSASHGHHWWNKCARNVFMSPYPLALFMNLIKGFFDFTFYFCCLLL